MPSPQESHQAAFEAITSTAGYGSTFKHGLKIVEMDDVPLEDSNGRRRGEGFRCVWEGVVGDDWTNLVGGMHGAAVAWVVDTCTSATIVPLSTETFWGAPMWSGVSLTMDIQYFHPAPVGTTILISCTILRLSSSLANIDCKITNKNTGMLYSSGSHVKYWKSGETRAKL